MLDLDCDPFYFETRHLSFLALTSYVESLAESGERYLVGLTYCLEAGVIHWYGTPSSQSSPLHLRQNMRLSPSDRGQLASWEPMTDDKMVLLAIELGVMGDVQTPVDEQPDFMAIAVNPQGFVYRWDGSRRIYLSDVQTLAGVGQDLFHERGYLDSDLWEKHSFISTSGESTDSEEYTRYAQGTADDCKPGILPSLLDYPRPEPPDSLTEWSKRVVPPTPDPRTDTEREFSAEAAAFVQHYFRVDPSQVDMKAANLARFMNARYGMTAPFDPRKALTALRAAIATNLGRTGSSSSAPTVGPVHGHPTTPRPPQAFDR